MIFKGGNKSKTPSPLTLFNGLTLISQNSPSQPAHNAIKKLKKYFCFEKVLQKWATVNAGIEIIFDFKHKCLKKFFSGFHVTYISHRNVHC